ncbi:unnamed protein product [Sphenostylis stenocarpa]|uniref:Uncharacterized protein n=1 Tax=Sphenostylis stenocarpa TaxID=92480 RepID=A0AA86SHU3_9FABA|nr:unnamed protein product [Sphenostylis stenocarpa]
MAGLVLLHQHSLFTKRKCPRTWAPLINTCMTTNKRNTFTSNHLHRPKPKKASTCSFSQYLEKSENDEEKVVKNAKDNVIMIRVSKRLRIEWIPEFKAMPPTTLERVFTFTREKAIILFHQGCRMLSSINSIRIIDMVSRFTPLIIRLAFLRKFRPHPIIQAFSINQIWFTSKKEESNQPVP